MKSYQYTCCQRDANGNLIVLDLKTPVVSANTPSEALEMLKSFFESNNCRPFREVT